MWAHTWTLAKYRLQAQGIFGNLLLKMEWKLRRNHSVVWCFYDGNQQFAQGWSTLISAHTEEVNIRPRWRLLQQLETKGPGWYSLAEREQLFTKMTWYWQWFLCLEHLAYWQDQLCQLRQPAPPIEFPGEQGMLTSMYAQVREKEQVISLQFIGSQQDCIQVPEKEAEASRWWYCYSVTAYTALDLDYFLLKTWWKPGIVDCRESLSFDLSHSISYEILN